ncbi:ATP-grasp fold amidoligase family protein [uncultured Succiniclasticum sp.]|uniref:ATP-grasp fold amidoligase family protein n=1 Tax=uncultured Succiniclasticum sp. TaxID=1500547 RepID=UPI0025CC0086|nr:ATP-grasp fold amidoligase family protein [uncultured Succiniclasticum sp.]
MSTRNIVSKGVRYLTDKGYRFAVNCSLFDMYQDMPDDEYLKRLFRYRMGYDLNLDNPKTFNEKLQWLKLYDRKPEYTTMVDKYEVKAYVAERIGIQYIIPTLGVWNHFDEIDFDKLPDQFVLKCTHDSGGIVICHDKEKLDIQKAKNIIEQSLKRNFYSYGREWPYKNVKPRILAEKYMQDKNVCVLRGDLTDYKLYCFEGEPKFCQVIQDRSTNETIDFYDMNWKKEQFTGLHFPGKPFPHSNRVINKPVSFDDMKNKAKILSKDMLFVRIDFYDISGRMYFGEITFYPASGFGVFEPDQWNYKLGEMINLQKLS